MTIDREPLDAGDEEGVPVELTELHQVLEWEKLTKGDRDDHSPS